MKRVSKIITISLMVCSLLITLIGCSPSSAKKVVIYTNADEEAVASMKKSLDTSGYEGKYVLQTQGTSELGGKLMAEGDKIEANLVTMSSYFIDSAQKKNNMFENLNFTTNSLEKYPSYYTPILANTGAIFVNTKVMKEKGLAMPKSIKDLTKDEYKGLVSIPNIMNSSTAWLLIQSIISEYGEKEGSIVLHKLILNCGPHIETSGSGPIKKVRVGEVAVGFGLRHQAVADKTSGKDIDYIDPIEGNYSLTESIAVVKKKDTATTRLAMEMAKVIVTKARPELIKNYPVALYTGETIDNSNKPGNPKKFESPLTVELLAKHQEFFKASK
ncbi:extracellular solute-binding protein [Clostridium bowmanii]|uniref:extracellular solute-binding protein n=1 Tax=Clostridium bowmanii TaxID=132925 RepID=UPI001C0C136A|nr:extracellular solute-binding protein [Clostridium bowmanii]MBU3189504.1 extracellular solute-binding protein [Clostridium bowmanii]MCA1074119.1 extracellular solute-binding protein [Clostridium bowmanii]